MRYSVVFLFIISAITLQAQNTEIQKVKGIVVNEFTRLPKNNVNVININTVKGTVTNESGAFEIEAQVNDTLHFSYVGFQSIKLRVTNDWMKSNNTQVQLTEKAYALEEIVIPKFKLTGYIEVDTKLLAKNDNYRYAISGQNYGYEGGQSLAGINKVMGALFNPADALYKVFGKKNREMKKLREFRKDETIRNALTSKYDRETVASLLGIKKSEINTILQRCNYSEIFIQTANDLQIMDAIKSCYEDYRVLKKEAGF